ncbi:MAG: hypothetical protein R6X27_15235 [Candidatus Desulfacyla sp.]
MKEDRVTAFLQLAGPFLPENLHVSDDGDNSLKKRGDCLRVISSPDLWYARRSVFPLSETSNHLNKAAG